MRKNQQNYLYLVVIIKMRWLSRNSVDLTDMNHITFGFVSTRCAKIGESTKEHNPRSCHEGSSVVTGFQSMRTSMHYSDIIMSAMASNHRRLDCLLNRLFRRRPMKTSKLRITGLCEGNSPATGEFPAQRASNVETVSIWWRHHEQDIYLRCFTECSIAKRNQLNQHWD